MFIFFRTSVIGSMAQSFSSLICGQNSAVTSKDVEKALSKVREMKARSDEVNHSIAGQGIS